MEDKGETDRFIETSDGYQLYTWAHVFGLWSVGARTTIIRAYRADIAAHPAT